MANLLHGTTRARAEQIVAQGPDPDFLEPGSHVRAEGFSTCLESGPFLFGNPEEYACRKAALFPGEGGAVIVKMDVPENIVEKACSQWFPRGHGLIQFDREQGLEELLLAWPTLPKEIIAVNCDFLSDLTEAGRPD